MLLIPVFQKQRWVQVSLVYKVPSQKDPVSQQTREREERGREGEGERGRRGEEERGRQGEGERRREGERTKGRGEGALEALLCPVP